MSGTTTQGDMTAFQKYGRLFFAIAIIAFGIQHFLFNHFVTGRAPAWPAPVPGRLVWVYFSGVIFIATGLAFLLKQKIMLVSIVFGTVIFLWAFLRNIILAVNDPTIGLAWTCTGKALALFGGACAMAASATTTDTGKTLFGAASSKNSLFYISRVSLGLFMILGGIQHFLFSQFVQTLVPVWIPFPYFWTCFAGVALIAGGLGLMFNFSVKLAATLTGIMIFIWFIILHIPRAVAAGYNANEWTAATEALAFSGIAFVLTGFRKNSLT